MSFLLSITMTDILQNSFNDDKCSEKTLVIATKNHLKEVFNVNPNNAMPSGESLDPAKMEGKHIFKSLLFL